MLTIWSALFVTVVVACGVVIARPLLRSREGFADDAASELDVLLEEKARTLRAVKDLEHEHASGFLADEDFDAARREYVERAARLNREIAALTGVDPTRPVSTGGGRAGVEAGRTGRERAAR
jgi:hypothetical protein